MLKDPDAIVGYNSFEGEEFEGKFAKYDVTNARYANRPVTVDNDIDEILKLL
jgi:hypothetical protein